MWDADWNVSKICTLQASKCAGAHCHWNQHHTKYDEAHRRKSQHPARAKNHWKYSEIPTLSTSTWNIHLNISHILGKALVDYQRKMILTVNCQTTGKNAVVNCHTLLKDEQGKAEETTLQAESSLGTLCSLATEQWRTRIPASSGYF